MASIVTGLETQTEIGGCRLESVAGQGGMAVVWRAVQLALDRQVAVKVMANRFAEDLAFRQRFEREFKIASQIDHPNVVPIYYAGEDRGRLFIVMKFVEGSNLQQILLRSGRLDPFRAIHVISQVAEALDVAHARTLVHRDIKPSNVLIDGSTGHVYLTDFGLAKEISDTSLTETDRVMGTARYVAPERMRGEDHGTVRGDIYSLGFLLWDLLTGIERPDPETIPGVTPALRAVVFKAVALQPRDRYASAGALAQAARDALHEGQRVAELETTQLLPPPSVRGARGAFGPEAFSVGLAARVKQLCDAALERLDDDEPRRAVLSIKRSLDEPLRIAVAGRASAGKSTLVNALLGSRVAQTGAGETTRFVAWYRHGSPERVSVVLEDGKRLERGLLPDGTLPSSFGVEPEQIQRIDVWLPADSLKSATIIDTPGLASLTDASARATIGIDDDDTDSRAIRQAEALLFAMAGDADAEDEEALRAFRARFHGADRASAVNALGVLTKADKAGEGGAEDPWVDAVEKAERVRHELGALVSAVVPVIGLLAETANTGSLSEDDAAALRWLASLPADQREQLSGDPDALLGAELPVPIAERQKLFERLGTFGLERAFELADANQLSAVGLVQRIRELSGIEELRKQMDGFTQRADALKADAALTRLEQLSWSDKKLAFLRGQVQRVRREPAMHVLELFRALDRCATKQIELPPEMMAELERLVTARSLSLRLGLGDDAGTTELGTIATARQRAWKAFENDPTTRSDAGRVAFAVSRSYEILLKQAIQTERGAG